MNPDGIFTEYAEYLIAMCYYIKISDPSRDSKFTNIAITPSRFAAALLMAASSASALLRVIHCCVVLHPLRKWVPRMMQPPLVLSPVTRHPAQSLSEYAAVSFSGVESPTQLMDIEKERKIEASEDFFSLFRSLPHPCLCPTAMAAELSPHTTPNNDPTTSTAAPKVNVLSC